MLTNLNQHIKWILEHDLASAPVWQRFLYRSLQIAYASLRDLANGHLSLRAMSLVYTTLITLVPLLAISFSVLKGFGVHNQIEPMLLNLLEGLGPEKSQEVATRVIDFVDNVEVGVLGAVGLALLIYAVISLMQKIESAFNYIWRVGQNRTFAQRFSNYLSVLVMGPLLIFISAGITTTVRNYEFFQQIIAFSGLGSVLGLLGILVPWFVMAIGFTFIYTYMPNTKVRISAAFIGALVAALLWKVMGYMFSSFIAGSADYVAIYAAFATLIVLMIWLYASWLVVLIGSNVAFYVQYPRYLRISREPLVLSPHMRMILGLAILSVIAQRHYSGEEPAGSEALSRELNVPILAIQHVLAILEDGGIIIGAEKKDPIVYYPGMPFDRTPLQTAIDILEKQTKSGWQFNQKAKVPAAVTTVASLLEQSRSDALDGVTIAQALLPPT
jgi:membrane protein